MKEDEHLNNATLTLQEVRTFLQIHSLGPHIKRVKGPAVQQRCYCAMTSACNAEHHEFETLVLPTRVLFKDQIPYSYGAHHIRNA